MRARGDAPDASVLGPPGGDAPDASMLGVARLNVTTYSSGWRASTWPPSRKVAYRDVEVTRLKREVETYLSMIQGHEATIASLSEIVRELQEQIDSLKKQIEKLKPPDGRDEEAPEKQPEEPGHFRIAADDGTWIPSSSAVVAELTGQDGGGEDPGGASSD